MSTIGIDLGTTNSEVAWIAEGEPRLLSIGGSALVPSAVSLAADGSILIGTAALNNELASPQETVRWIKRKMGTDQTLQFAGKTWTPAMISSLILRHLKQAVEAHLGTPVTRAVVTVPAFFTERAREDTREAARLAGLDVLRLVSEPSAAAAAYARANRRDETWLVYDLGGGTFDVSVVASTNGVTEVRASHGDTQLGGHDFDRQLAQLAADDFEKRHGIDLTEDPRAWARLLRAAEAAKIRLSSEAVTSLREEHIATSGGVDLHLDFALRRSTYEELIGPAIERTIASVRNALIQAGCQPKSLSRVLLVGGVTRTPLVQRRLREALGLEPQAWIDPDTVVAQGAAVEAAALAGEQVAAAMVDITPHSLGVAALGEDDELENVVLIRRNTPLPCSADRLFFKTFDEQERIDVAVYQGESPRPERNHRIGEFQLDGLGKGDTDEVHCRFSLDRSGLLQVSVTDLGSGKVVTRTINRPQPAARAGIADLGSVQLVGAEGLAETEAGTSAWESANAPAQAGSPAPAEEPADDLIAQAQALLQRGDLDPADREELLARVAGTRSGDEVMRAKLKDLVYFLG